MPREYSLLAEDILKYNPRLIMAGGGVDLSAKEANLLGKSTSYPKKAKEKRDTEKIVSEFMDVTQDELGREAYPWINQEGAAVPNPDSGTWSSARQNFAPYEGGESSGGGWGGSIGGGSGGGSDWFGAFTEEQGMAQGGPVQEGQPYVVGEEGPEMFVPNQSGTIVPNDKSFSQGIQEFWNELFGGQGVAQEDFIKQPPLMPRDSTIGGITPVPTPPNPYEGTFDAFQADSPRRPDMPWAR